MPNSFQMGDFDLDVESIVLVHRCVFEHGIHGSDYRAGRGVAGIVYCLSGLGKYVFDETNGRESEELFLAPGRMLFLPADSRYIVASEGTEPFCHITVNFRLAGAKGEENTAFDAILSNRFRYMSSEAVAAVSEELLERLLSVWQNKTYGFTVLARSVLYEILYLYFTDAVRFNSSGDDYRKILPAKTFIDAHYAENQSVSELADMCRLSETHFRRLFARLFGCSPVAYRLQKRLLKAKDLLLFGEYSVAEAAQAVGFDDANYFGRVFRAHMGMTPSEAAKGI